MSASALLLVLAGAICHALWNIVAKRAAGGLVFVWLFGVVSIVAATPLAWWVWTTHPQHFDHWMWFAALLSGLVHVFYSLVLQQGYRSGDFAVVYPVARGTGPMLSVIAAVVVLGERPSVTGWIGVAAVVAGVYVSAGIAGLARQDAQHQDAQHRRLAGVLWGMLTGVFIAGYTVIDGWAIKSLGMAPILFYAVGLIFRTVLLTPFALRRPAAVREQWQAHRGAVIVVGVLSPAAYTLILLAVQIAPLSYVAPIREISMLIGTLAGAYLLKEAVKPFQVIGAMMMLLGVAGLALA